MLALFRRQHREFRWNWLIEAKRIHKTIGAKPLQNSPNRHTGEGDCVVIANNIITYPPLAEVSRSDGGG